MVSTTSVKYLHEIVGSDKADGYTLHRRPVKKTVRYYGGFRVESAPGQGEDGYGAKITTDYVVKIPGDKKEYRVYCTCYSNNGSNWINYKGERVHLRTHFQDEILDD